MAARRMLLERRTEEAVDLRLALRVSELHVLEIEVAGGVVRVYRTTRLVEDERGKRRGKGHRR